jgi:Clp amino terminal domain, pathogenicity island component
MITLDAADLAVIAGQVLGISPGAALDRLNLPAAHAALAETQRPETQRPETQRPETQRADGGLAAAAPAEAEPADAALAAIVLIRALLRHRPFPDHSQQVAVAAGLQLLALNGWQADLDPPGAALVVIEGLASGRLSPADAATWLSPRLSSYAKPVREKPMRTRLRLRALDPRPRAGVHTPVTGFLPFTDDARDAAVWARQEAGRLGLGQLGPGLPGPEQFLLGLIATGDGVAVRVLNRLGISPEAVRQRVAEIASEHQPSHPSGPDTPLAMRVMPRAIAEAVAHGHDYIGTEHILLGLFHAGDDTAAQVLASLGAGETEVRGAITAVTGDSGPARHAPHRPRKPVPRDDEIRRLRREVARLCDLLRENGIEPGGTDQKIA